MWFYSGANNLSEAGIHPMPAYVGSHNKTSGEPIMTLMNVNLNKKDAGTGKKEGHLMLLIFLLMRMVKY
jgi:hypothetical protein